GQQSLAQFLNGADDLHEVLLAAQICWPRVLQLQLKYDNRRGKAFSTRSLRGDRHRTNGIANGTTETVDLFVIGFARIRIEHRDRSRDHQRGSRTDSLRGTDGDRTQTVS